MSVGRVEILDGKKQYNEYAGRGNFDAKSDYVYIERFVKTETLLSEWKLTFDDANSNICIYANMYNALTGEYIAKNSGGERYVIGYVPISFNMIPYYNIFKDLYPVKELIINAGFFASIGVDVDITQGIFKFTNQKRLSENPIYTWYKNYANKTGSTNDLKESYQAMLFRGYLRKLETNDPMYLKTGTKTLEDAESNIY
ncbi:hypothetical protein [Schaedlerella arabinosiphila]|uniref:hypothetical protein n=1 Tax=Schaedlerella arabinosiphila TaxID=2044587 RepID=UPI002557DDA7|nr:hypothetical protein [Schaedlerella arabinosiphila]